MDDRARNDERTPVDSRHEFTDKFDLSVDHLSRRDLILGTGGLGGLLLGGRFLASLSEDEEPTEMDPNTPNRRMEGELLARPAGDNDDSDGDVDPEENPSDADDEPDEEGGNEDELEEFTITDPALERHIEEYGLPDPPALADIPTERTRDAVDDLGLDPSGQDPIQGTLANALNDGDRIEFPDGTYRLSGPLDIHNRRNFALVGTGDATFVVDSGLTRSVMSYRDCQDCAFVGIDIDQSASNCSAQTSFNTAGQLVVADVEFVGWSDPDDSGKKIAFNVRDSSGVARFERVIANDGTEVGRQGVDHNDVHKQQYDGAYWSGPPHTGTAYLIDCEAAHWSDNGLYASRTNGGIIVAGGYYANSSISQVRLGHPESFVGNGCEMLVDRDQIPDEHNPSGLAFTRGVWLESGSLNNAGATVGECFIEVGSVGSFGGCINVVDSARNAVIEGTVEVIAPGSIDRLNARTTVDLRDDAIQNVEVFSADGDNSDEGDDGEADEGDAAPAGNSSCG